MVEFHLPHFEDIDLDGAVPRREENRCRLHRLGALRGSEHFKMGRSTTTPVDDVKVDGGPVRT